MKKFKHPSPPPHLPAPACRVDTYHRLQNLRWIVFIFAAAFFILVPLAIWIYTLVFAFSSLWFAHYCLAALERLRSEGSALSASVVPVGDPAAVAIAASSDFTPAAFTSENKMP